jgi:cation diffusion facilitator CzcD-associated flavoprotein CzcO
MAEQTIQIKNIANIDAHLDYQAVVIGAGVAGIYQIKRLADLDVRATVLDANADLGGTWYNNRYPGARFDSESYTYSYSFSKELLDEWHWTEKFSPQPETLHYLNYVTDKFELRKYMQFGCRVESMVFDEDMETWTIRLDDGRQMTTRFVITGVGVLSTPTLPKIEGMASF